MLKVNMSDGRTLSFELNNSSEFKEWKKFISNDENQKKIRGVGIVYNTQWHALPIPRKFKYVRYDADLIINDNAKTPEKKLVGERVICFIDDIKLSLLVYYGNRPKMSRIDAIKIGRARYLAKP